MTKLNSQATPTAMHVLATMVRIRFSIVRMSSVLNARTMPRTSQWSAITSLASPARMTVTERRAPSPGGLSRVRML